MINFEVDGKNLQFSTKEMSFLDYFKLIQPYLPAEELLVKIPKLGEYGITADDVEAEIMSENKYWKIFKLLVENGLSVAAVCRWYGSDHVEPCEDLEWLFSFYLNTGISPDELARKFSDFLSRELLDERKNVEVLLNLGVSPTVLIKDVMTKDQVVEHFNLLYSRGIDMGMVIDTMGDFPNFYGKYPVEYLVDLGAKPLQISEYIFYKMQPYDEAEKYLRDLYHNGLNLTEFVSQVVIAKNSNLHIVVQFAQFFVDRYIDVKSVLKHVAGNFTKVLSRREMENKLVILANFSELAAMGLIDEPKKTKKQWRWEFNQIQRSIFDEVIDSHGYYFSFFLDDFKFADEMVAQTESTARTEDVSEEDLGLQSFLMHEVQKSETPEMAPTVAER